MTMCASKETIAGVPIGLSRDYDQLPQTGPLRSVRCSTCWQEYEDVERCLMDGVRILALTCGSCREKGRARWIAERANRVELPRAVAAFRKCDLRE